MCIQAALAPLIGAFGGAGAAAATGATAAAGTAAAGTAAAGASLGSVLQTIGTVVSIGGALSQGAQAADAYQQQADQIAAQQAQEREIALVEDLRTRRRMRSQIAQQRAELGARGVSLDSPTALLLGDTAARELAFASQTVRSNAAARSQELSTSQRLSRSRAAGSVLTGRITAADRLLTAAPRIWPSLAGA